jgi:hypothetical protein
LFEETRALANAYQAGIQGVAASLLLAGTKKKAPCAIARELDCEFRGDYYSLLRASRKLTMLHLTLGINEMV